MSFDNADSAGPLEGTLGASNDSGGRHATVQIARESSEAFMNTGNSSESIIDLPSVAITCSWCSKSFSDQI